MTYKLTNRIIMPVIKEYYRLTKPGIIYGNLLTAIGGFLFGSQGHVSFSHLVAMAAGTSLVIASACVCNNYMDRDIDIYMARTKNRALATGSIPPQSALIYAAGLGTLGAIILLLLTNKITFILGLVGFVSYVWLYTPSKRTTVHSTLIGSISGATPIAAGYSAASGRFGVAAILLFVIMVIWQMPHFYAIAMFRREEYKAAGVPVLSVSHGMRVSKQYIIGYIAAFVVAVAALSLYGYAGFSFFVIMTLASLYWLWLAIKGLKTTDDIRWSRKLFGASLLLLLLLSFSLSIDPWLP